MNTMNTPGFTAGDSLYRTSNRYRSSEQGSESQRNVIPQLGGKGFKGYQGCVMDCLENPLLTRAICQRRCNDPGIAGTSSGSSLNNFLSGAGIDFWEIGCSALVSPYLCGKVADEIRRQS